MAGTRWSAGRPGGCGGAKLTGFVRRRRDHWTAAGNIPGETGAGLGIRGYGYLEREQWGHSGGSSLGSSLLLFDPSTGTTVAVIMNQGRGAQHFALAPQLLQIATSR